MVGDFGGEDGTKSLKVFSKPSTQARVSASEKEREVRVWRPPRLTLERKVCVSWRSLSLKPYRLKVAVTIKEHYRDELLAMALEPMG